MTTKRDNSEAAMAEYLNALLLEEETVEFDNEPVKRLLEQAAPKIQAVAEEETVSLNREQDLLPLVSAKADDSYKEPEVETVTETEVETETVDLTTTETDIDTEVHTDTETEVETEVFEVSEPPAEPLPDAMSEYMEQDFQALFLKWQA